MVLSEATIPPSLAAQRMNSALPPLVHSHSSGCSRVCRAWCYLLCILLGDIPKQREAIRRSANPKDAVTCRTHDYNFHDSACQNQPRALLEREGFAAIAAWNLRLEKFACCDVSRHDMPPGICGLRTRTTLNSLLASCWTQPHAWPVLLNMVLNPFTARSSTSSAICDGRLGSGADRETGNGPAPTGVFKQPLTPAQFERCHPLSRLFVTGAGSVSWYPEF